MDFVLEDQIHTSVSDTVYKDILSGTSAYCYFIGGINGASVNPTNATYKYELETRNNILATKKISPSDVSYVIPRYDWISGTVYDQYDDRYCDTYPAFSGATKLADAKFYVLTDDFNVYKCLKNAQNSPSTVKPTGNAVDRFTTSDGYIWKYMYSIPLSSRNKFLNRTVMPVQTSVQEQFYSSGKIIAGAILNPGSGYTNATINVVGDGENAHIIPVLDNGQIIGAIVDNNGTGYTYASINVSGNGTGAQIVADFSSGDLDTFQSNVELLSVSGTIENISIENGGHSYGLTTIQIFGDGTGATAVAHVTAGVITDVEITNPGYGYTFANVVVTGAGMEASLRAIISPAGGHGKNAVNELCARRLIFYTTISGEKIMGFPIVNSYVQLGIMRNIREFTTPSRFYGSNGSPLYAFTISGTPVEINDDLVNAITGSRYKVFATQDNQILVQNFDNEKPFINITLNNLTRGGQNRVDSIVEPNIDKFSGEMLYIDNVQAIQSSSDQIVTFKTSLKF